MNKLNKINSIRSFTKTELRKELMFKYKYTRASVINKNKEWLVCELTRLYQKEQE